MTDPVIRVGLKLVLSRTEGPWVYNTWLQQPMKFSRVQRWFLSQMAEHWPQLPSHPDLRVVCMYHQMISQVNLPWVKGEIERVLTWGGGSPTPTYLIKFEVVTGGEET